MVNGENKFSELVFCGKVYGYEIVLWNKGVERLCSVPFFLRGMKSMGERWNEGEYFEENIDY